MNKKALDQLIEEAKKIIDELTGNNIIDNLSEIAKIRLEKIIRQAELFGFNQAYELFQDKLSITNNLVKK